MAWEVIKGNTSVQDIAIRDKDGVLVTNLASATAIVFQVKKSKVAITSEIEKTKGDGIAVDTPETGYLRITLTPTETAMDINNYFMALEITWSATNKYEVLLKMDDVETNIFIIKQDIIQ